VLFVYRFRSLAGKLGGTLSEWRPTLQCNTIQDILCG